MDAILCRDHVQRLLADEAASLTQLETLLEQEFGFLSSNDLDGLERATAKRQACMGELLRVEDERRNLCRMSGHSGDLAGLELLLKWCDPAGSLQKRWQDCSTRATRCRTLNDRNGLVVASRLKRVEGLLGIITGKNQTPPTYGRRGAYASADLGRMVRSEA